jgi:hypothetical protein
MPQPHIEHSCRSRHALLLTHRCVCLSVSRRVNVWRKMRLRQILTGRTPNGDPGHCISGSGVVA